MSIEEIKNHPWFAVSHPVYINEGLIIGYNRIPIQKEILEIMSKEGFDIRYIERCLDANKHNHCTTTYYLHLKKSTLTTKLEVIKNSGKLLLNNLK